MGRPSRLRAVPSQAGGSESLPAWLDNYPQRVGCSRGIFKSLPASRAPLATPCPATYDRTDEDNVAAAARCARSGRFAVLPQADRALAVAWWIVLVLRGLLPAVFAIAMGVLVASVQRGARSGPPHPRRHRLRPAPGSDTRPPGGQRQPGRPHRRLALRPADRGLRRPARHGASRGSRARRATWRWPGTSISGSPGRRCRSRWTSSPAAGRADRRARLRRGAVRLRLVGAACARRRLARDALAAARERGLARPEHRGGPQRPARCRLRVSAGGGPAGGQGAAAVRAGGLDDRPVLARRHAAARAAVAGDATARAAGALECAARRLAANVLVFWSLADGRADGRLPRRGSSSSPGGRRHRR